MLVHRHLREQLCHFLKKTTSIVTLLSVGSFLHLVGHEHKCVTNGTTVRISKTLGSVQCLQICNANAASLFTTLWLNFL